MTAGVWRTPPDFTQPQHLEQTHRNLQIKTENTLNPSASHFQRSFIFIFECARRVDKKHLTRHFCHARCARVIL